MNRIVAAATVAVVLLLGGCWSSDNGPEIGPPDPSSGNGNPGNTPPATPATAAVFRPLQGLLPFPTDLYFSGSTDGTLNLPANALMPSLAAMNSLDGFSTTAVIRARFGSALDPATFTASSVRVFPVTIDNTTKATTGIGAPLVLGTDFEAGLAPETGVGNTILEIRPLKPLRASTGATNNGYLVLLTNEIKTSTGAVTTPDSDYANIKAALPSCAAITNSTLNGICRLVGAHLQLAAAASVNPANVVLSFSFSTQSTRDSLDIIANTAVAQPIAAVNSGLTTKQVNTALAGKANVYAGTINLPYYLSRTAPLTGAWQANPSPNDASSRHVTRFNPVPITTETLPAPLLVTVPNATAAAGANKPASGWPVLIFQHGITGDRTNMFPVADAFADAGFVVVAIDQPLHGITNANNPLYARTSAGATTSIERTFDLDLVNNQTGAAGADGIRDSSGTHFINIASLLTSRDNLRQAAADLLTLSRSVQNLDLDGIAGGDIDPARIHFMGHSLGAIVGTVYLGVAPASSVKTATLAMPGGGVAKFLRESPAFSPRLLAGLAAQGLTEGTTLLEQFFRDAQTVIDSGDPWNYVAAAAAQTPIHMLQVVGTSAATADQVIPNSATQRLITAAALTKIPQPAAPGPVINPAGHRAYVNFTAGDHSSILNPAGSAQVTVEMQRESVFFALGLPTPPAAPGTAIVISNPSVIQP